MSVGERIKKLRKELHLTQQAFADKIRMKRNSVGLIETGRDTSDQTIFTICREFNVNEEWLREGKGEMFNDADEGLIAQVAAEYNLDDNARALAKTFLSLSAERRAVIVQAVKIIAEEYAAKVNAEHSEQAKDTAEKPLATTHMVEMTDEEYAEFMRDRTAREFEKKAAGFWDSAS